MATKQWEVNLSNLIKTAVVETGVLTDPAVGGLVLVMNDVDEKRTTEIVAGWTRLKEYLVEVPVDNSFVGFATLPIGNTKGQVVEVANAAAVPAGSIGISVGAPSNLIDGVTLFVQMGFQACRDYSLENYFKFV